MEKKIKILKDNAIAEQSVKLDIDRLTKGRRIALESELTESLKVLSGSMNSESNEKLKNARKELEKLHGEKRKEKEAELASGILAGSDATLGLELRDKTNQVKDKLVSLLWDVENTDDIVDSSWIELTIEVDKLLDDGKIRIAGLNDDKKK